MGFQELFEHAVDFQPGSPAEMDSTLRQVPAVGGVYLLSDDQDRLIQLASSGDLRRALRSRLAPPAAAAPTGVQGERPAGSSADATGSSADASGSSAVASPAPVAGSARPRADLSRIVRRIWWRTAHSMFEVDFEYWRLARQLMPDAYLRNLAFGPAWFVHVDPAGAIPRFLSGKLLQSPPGVDLGPFATQADANRFVQTLEDVFDLCRYYDILQQVPHGQPCAYFEMGRCPAPCNGTIPMSAYRETVAEALAFACGQRRERYAIWEGRMREAAEALAYEKAGLLKQRLERARTLEHTAFRLVRPIADFHWLIIQRAGGRTRLKPFFVHAGSIEPGEPVKLNQIEAAAGGWVDRLRKAEDASSGRPIGTAPGEVSERPARQEQPDGQERGEQIWLVGHYLFKRETPGLFLHASEFGDAATLAKRIRSHFVAKPPPVDEKRCQEPFT